MKTAMYNARYEAYEDGRLFDKEHEKFLKINKMNGAVYYRIYIDGKARMKAIGLVILSAFVPKPSAKHRFALHKDMDINNIHLDNLVWSTSATWLPDGRRYKIRSTVRTDEDLLRSFRKSWIPGDIKIDGRKYYDCRYTGYKLSKYGDVLSFFSYPPKKLKFGRTGHRSTVTLRVRIDSRFSERKFYVDEIMAEAFCPKLDQDDLVAYIDGDPTNVRANNLKWTKSLNLFTEFQVDDVSGLVVNRKMDTISETYEENDGYTKNVTPADGSAPEIEAAIEKDALQEKLEEDLKKQAEEEEAKKKKEVKNDEDFKTDAKIRAKGMKPDISTDTILAWAKGNTDSTNVLYKIANAKDEVYNKLINMLGDRGYVRGVKIHRLYLLAHEELDLMVELMKLSSDYILEKALMQPNDTGRSLTDQYIQKWLDA